MSKTFLQLQNLVYANLRVDQITDFSGADDYEIFIRRIINQAKQSVEDAWQWHVFRKEITWGSVASQHEYDLTATQTNGGDADNSSNVWLAGRSYPYHDPYGQLLAFDTTTSGQAFKLRQVPYWWAVKQKYENTTDSAKPDQVYTTSNGIGFAYAPDSGNRTYAMIAIIPQAELDDTDTGDTMTLPYWQAVVSLATAWAISERGEELGSRSHNVPAVLNTDWAMQADRDIAQAISRDSTYDASELMMDAGQIPWQGGSGGY